MLYYMSKKVEIDENVKNHIFQAFGYLPPLTKLAAQTEFSQLEKDCSGSSKDGHGLKFER